MWEQEKWFKSYFVSRFLLDRYVGCPGCQVSYEWAIFRHEGEALVIVIMFILARGEIKLEVIIIHRIQITYNALLVPHPIQLAYS